MSPHPPLGQSPASCCCDKVPRTGLTWHLRQVRARQPHEHVSRRMMCEVHEPDLGSPPGALDTSACAPQGRPALLSGACARHTSSWEAGEKGFTVPPWCQLCLQAPGVRHRVPRCLQTQPTQDFQAFPAAGKGLACGQLRPATPDTLSSGSLCAVTGVCADPSHARLAVSPAGRSFLRVCSALHTSHPTWPSAARLNRCPRPPPSQLTRGQAQRRPAGNPGRGWGRAGGSRGRVVGLPAPWAPFSLK